MRDEYLEEHLEEENDFLFQTDNQRPRIFEGLVDQEIPPNFDAVMIELDGRLHADLQWKSTREKADLAVEKGLRIFWNLNLGLFSQLSQPLKHQAQFLSLALSLEHFRDTLWKEYQKSTLAVSLYQGPADFHLDLIWDLDQEHNFKSWLKENCLIEESEMPVFRKSQEGMQLMRLFCRDVAIEYILLLASRLPDTLLAYLFLDACSFNDSLANELQYFNPERFQRLHLAVKNGRLPLEALGWGAPASTGYCGTVSSELPLLGEIKIGICVPPAGYTLPKYYQMFEEVLIKLQSISLPYKLIAEDTLTSQWDGLDYLLFNPSGLSSQGKRKLQGFCAAGGTAVSLGSPIGLSQELTLQQFAELFFSCHFSNDRLHN